MVCGTVVLSSAAGLSLSKTKRCPLALSSLLFVPPAVLLLEQGLTTLGVCCAVLAATSIVYHALHSPLSRAIDVSMCFVTGSAGLCYSLSAVLSTTRTPALLASLAATPLVVSINCLPIFRMRGEPDVLSRPAHMLMHFCGAAGLALFAVHHGQVAPVA